MWYLFGSHVQFCFLTPVSNTMVLTFLMALRVWKKKEVLWGWVPAAIASFNFIGNDVLPDGVILDTLYNSKPLCYTKNPRYINLLCCNKLKKCLIVWEYSKVLPGYPSLHPNPARHFFQHPHSTSVRMTVSDACPTSISHEEIYYVNGSINKTNNTRLCIIFQRIC